MEPRARIAEDAEEPDELPEAFPQAGYRVAGNLQECSADLEQELALTKERLADMERHVWAANAAVRRRAVASALSFAGHGAFAGTIVGWALQLVSPDPVYLLVGSAVGLVLGAVVGAKWPPPKHGSPPPSAPPYLP